VPEFVANTRGAPLVRTKELALVFFLMLSLGFPLLCTTASFVGVHSFTERGAHQSVSAFVKTPDFDGGAGIDEPLDGAVQGGSQPEASIAHEEHGTEAVFGFPREMASATVPSLTSLAGDAQPPLIPTRKLALCVGVDDYSGTGLVSLPTAANDARLLGKRLEGLGFETTVLVNPTYEQLRHAIFKLKWERGNDDLVVLHFAGHADEAKNALVLPRAAAAASTILSRAKNDSEPVLSYFRFPDLLYDMSGDGWSSQMNHAVLLLDVYGPHAHENCRCWRRGKPERVNLRGLKGLPLSSSLVVMQPDESGSLIWTTEAKKADVRECGAEKGASYSAFALEMARAMQHDEPIESVFHRARAALVAHPSNNGARPSLLLSTAKSINLHTPVAPAEKDD